MASPYIIVTSNYKPAILALLEFTPFAMNVNYSTKLNNWEK